MKDHAAARAAGIAEWRRRTNERIQSTPDEHAAAVVEAGVRAFLGYQYHGDQEQPPARQPAPDDRPVIFKLPGGDLLAGHLSNGRVTGRGQIEYDFTPIVGINEETTS